jgi:hypothetical protein
MFSSLFVKRNDIPSLWSRLISFKTEGPISSSQLNYHFLILKLGFYSNSLTSVEP